MHVHRISAINFRAFGTKEDGTSLCLVLNKGLNVLVGENDAGKSSIMDAIRYALLTTSNDYLRIEDDDFHIKGVSHAEELQIEVEIQGLSVAQQAALLEWLTLEPNSEPYLVVHLQARRRIEFAGTRFTQPQVRVHAGRGGTGPELGSAARELIKATYLKPLRDAVSELRPKKASRLSQVLRAHKDVKREAVNNFDKSNPDAPPQTLVEVMAQAQHRISKQPVITDVRDQLNSDYLSSLSFEGAPLTSDIRMATELTLAQVLERLELTLGPPGTVDPAMSCERGLGYNNVLFMAAELLLLGSGDELALLLIEEPEAHLHPQLQARVLEMLAKKAAAANIQIIVSTHSPNIASSAPVGNLVLVCKGKTYRLAIGETRLEPSDYNFLGRFLDVTKANLFFARGLALVEGAAEEILLPALAEACGRSFVANGISTVNVGSVGLFRYARVLQRHDGKRIPIPVACLTDRDIVPDNVPYVEGRLSKEARGVPLPKNRKTHTNRKVADFTLAEIQERVQRKVDRAKGDLTEVFVSDVWTLEYDLLMSECADIMFFAIRLAQAEGSKGALDDVEMEAALTAANCEWTALTHTLTLGEIAAEAYEPLYSEKSSKAIVAQYAAMLFEDRCAGEGEALLNKLPTYLKRAFQHLVPKAEDLA